MVMTLAPQLLKLLSNDLRWQLLLTISQSDLRVQEIMQAVGQPQNLVSYHLKKLHAAGLVIEHRSIADGREVYYGIHLKNIRENFNNIQNTLHPGLTIQGIPNLPTPPVRILILCTHNSARSQMAEGFIKAKSHGKIEIFSAGANPQPVNPLAIQVMADYGIDIHAHQSKNQARFVTQSFDYVITVCDRARETCPIFSGSPTLIHWSIADPTTPTASPQSQIERFQSAAQELEERINFFMAGIGKHKS